MPLGFDPRQFSKCLRDAAAGLLGCLEGKLINFDGKKLKGFPPRSKGNHGLYILSAWASGERLCIGQKKVRGKTCPKLDGCEL